MDNAYKGNFRDRLFDILTTRVVYHVLFWLAILLILTIVEGTQHGFLFTFSNELINLFFYGLIVYFNLLYLIPNYLNQKRFLTYALLLILSAIIITPLKMLVFYFKFSGMPQAQQEIVSNQYAYFLITFLIAGTSTIFKIVTDWARQLKNKQELETQTMQTELRFLKSQINPHFLFNTLNNLYALTLKKSDEAPEIVIKLSEMMRYMLYECNEKRVLLSKEIHYIRNYLDLERIRQGKNVNITFTVEGSANNEEIAPLLFIPYLENAFKHGLSNQIDHGFVDIRMHIEKDMVSFFIENTKAPVRPQADPNRKSGGIGLVNVHRRLNLIYPEKYDLRIDNHPNTYAVELTIELD
ncbi:MAG TPA: histidine kinase [Bacteroidales bacterium]|nr:histidine kinase [Bacteroidales bacterium]